MGGGDLLNLLIERDTFPEDFTRFYVADVQRLLSQCWMGVIYADADADADRAKRTNLRRAECRSSQDAISVKAKKVPVHVQVIVTQVILEDWAAKVQEEFLATSQEHFRSLNSTRPRPTAAAVVLVLVTERNVVHPVLQGPPLPARSSACFRHPRNWRFQLRPTLTFFL
jgi:hypothetical protein